MNPIGKIGKIKFLHYIVYRINDNWVGVCIDCSIICSASSRESAIQNLDNDVQRKLKRAAKEIEMTGGTGKRGILDLFLQPLTGVNFLDFTCAKHFETRWQTFKVGSKEWKFAILIVDMCLKDEY